ncbi:MAG: RidA family protein [Planctomycetes bacterium]|nr:RidA family protein [Planctomycetota bacterium]
MSRRLDRLALLVVVVLLVPAWSWAQQPVTQLEYIGSDAATGSSQAVVVGPANLLHTTQLFALEPQGSVVGRTATEQAHKVFDLLATVLQNSGSDMSAIVKLNVCATSDAAAAEARAVMAARFSGGNKPAVTFAVGKLAHADALVAADAVAVTSIKAVPGQALRERVAVVPSPPSGLGGAHVGVLPAGPKVYVSGDAKPGDMSEATAATLASLDNTLKELGLTRESVVQLKCFLQPISAAPLAEAEIVKFFGGRPTPVVYVEWTMAGPIEIELIATPPLSSAAAGLPKSESVAFFTPSGVKASPVFSRVACLNSSQTMYISGLHSNTAGDGAHEVREVFQHLQKLLALGGSDLRHLVKATYYVTSDDTSKQLNALRPEYYDPARPPAASKASIAATGAPGRALTVDMIAAPPKR